MSRKVTKSYKATANSRGGATFTYPMVGDKADDVNIAVYEDADEGRSLSGVTYSIGSAGIQVSVPQGKWNIVITGLLLNEAEALYDKMFVIQRHITEDYHSVTERIGSYNLDLNTLAVKAQRNGEVVDIQWTCNGDLLRLHLTEGTWSITVFGQRLGLVKRKRSKQWQESSKPKAN